jgi:uncharacterized protein YndB with AHSA1/START domain
MSVTSVDKDYDKLTLTVIAEFDAGIEQIWELWSDPRKLENWWGPPGAPATFEKHDLTPGGVVTYFMTVEGEVSRGAWQVTAVDPPTSLEFRNGFADADGAWLEDGPVHDVTVQLGERDGRTRMEMLSKFDSREDMEKLMGFGMDEGLRAAVGQMDALLG